MNPRSTSTRLLTYYEDRSKTFLVRRVPVIIRLDGKCFHSFCKQFEKPYDIIFNECLSNTLIFLCKKIQGVVYGQRHSDELSLLLLDMQKPDSDAYFDYSVQKIVSVTASMCSTEFCRQLLLKTKLSTEREFPVFDCRAFNIPEFEVISYFWDRSTDCVRNSIQNLARTKFSDKQLHGKNSSEMQEMLFANHDINWAALPQEQKAGIYCHKVERQEKVPQILLPTTTHIKEPKAFVTRTSWNLEPVPQSKTQLRDAIQGCCKTSIERTSLISFAGVENE